VLRIDGVTRAERNLCRRRPLARSAGDDTCQVLLPMARSNRPNSLRKVGSEARERERARETVAQQERNFIFKKIHYICSYSNRYFLYRSRNKMWKMSTSLGNLSDALLNVLLSRPKRQLSPPRVTGGHYQPKSCKGRQGKRAPVSGQPEAASSCGRFPTQLREPNSRRNFFPSLPSGLFNSILLAF